MSAHKAAPSIHLPLALSAWLVIAPVWGAVLLAQQDTAATEATEAEWGASCAPAFRGDPFRDPALAGIGSAEAALHGREHLRRFLHQWGQLLAGTAVSPALHVVHLGGSHVQAGRIGWAFRNRLAEDLPGVISGRGIQAPHRLVDRNGPPERGWQSEGRWTGASCAHARHSGAWGVTGLEVRSDTPSPLSCWTGAPAGGQCCSDLRIVSRPGTAGRWVPKPDAPWVPDTVSLGWAGVASWRLATGGPIPDTLHLLPGWGQHQQPEQEGQPEFLQGVEWIPEDVHCVFHDLGANGAHSASWLRNPHFGDQLSVWAPGLVILAFGINDAHMAPSRFDAERFHDRYRALIDTIRSASPNSDILLVTNNDSHYRNRHNPNATRVREAMLALVDEAEVACWDLYTQLGGAGSIDALYTHGFAAADRLHMRRDGYILMGELLYDLLTRAALRTTTDAP